MMKEQDETVEKYDMDTGGDELSGNSSMDHEEDDDDAEDEDNEEVNDGCDQQAEDNDHEEISDESDQQVYDDEKQSEDDMLLEVSYLEEQAMEQLSVVFELLKMDPIHDKLNTNSIRSRISQVYTYLYGLCDILEGKSGNEHSPNPHELLVEESNDLLAGLKNLFNESYASEQVRLLTIAPKTWGREKIRK
ncbi:unnamed protein product [Rotaria sp. Silwood1]|nr:unnamed protein product [Rotaria sp. Silwood1]